MKNARTNPPVIVGILNLTPDSFSDGGSFTHPKTAINHAKQMIADGATIIDVGAESTRPNYTPITAQQEIERLSAVLPQLTRLNARVSIDTYKSETAEYALECGVSIVNDVYGGKMDDAILEVTARHNASYIITHNSSTSNRVNPQTSITSFLNGVIADLEESANQAKKAGIKDIILDAGIGFYKTSQQSQLLLREMDRIVQLGYPVMLAVSRKRVVREIVGIDQQDIATASISAIAHRQGVTYHRVHNVKITASALRTTHTIY